MRRKPVRAELGRQVRLSITTGPATVVRLAIYISIDLNHRMIILMLAMAHDPGRRIMRVIALVSLLSATLLLCSGAAEAAPWCAQYGGGDKGGGTNCGFYSFEQCMAAISGNGGPQEKIGS